MEGAALFSFRWESAPELPSHRGQCKSASRWPSLTRCALAFEGGISGALSHREGEIPVRSKVPPAKIPLAHRGHRHESWMGSLDTRRDKQGSTGWCPRDFLLSSIEKLTEKGSFAKTPAGCGGDTRPSRGFSEILCEFFLCAFSAP